METETIAKTSAKTQAAADAGASAENPAVRIAVSAGNTALLLAPAMALAVLAAHFYRASAWPMVGATLVAITLLVWRARWVPLLLQAFLLAGALEWCWTAFMLAQQRMALGAPWQRMVLILAVVAVLTAASAAVFMNRRVRARYGLR